MRASCRFHEYEYDPVAARLLRNGEVLPMQPRVLRALELFLEQPGALVSREALMEALWPGVFVTDNSLEQVITKLRRSLDDRSRPFRFVETASGLGYRFVASVQRAPSRPSPPLPDLPGFVGRADDLARLGAMLGGGERLITVLGSGGIGKTFLALRFASRYAAGAPDALTCFCDLTAASDRRGVLDAIGDGLDLPPAGRSLDTVAGRLVNERALLVLDNVEQIADPIAEVARTLLARASGLCLLLTSRVRLGLAAERCLELGPLPPPEAIGLLRDRAEATRAGLSEGLSDEEAARIVAVLEGVPLAIRLAASRLVLVSPGELSARLAESSAWLRARDRDLPDRQRSLAASVQWSWSLLPTEAAEAAARCGVFCGGLTLSTAEVALGTDDAADLLLTLRDASLLVALDVPGSPRFALPQPVREHALAELERLGTLEAARQRLVSWAAAQLEPVRSGQPEPRRQAAAERENLWAAASWATDPRDLVSCARLLYTIDEHTNDPPALGAILDRAVAAAEADAPELLFPVLNERALFRRYRERRPADAERDIAWLDRLASTRVERFELEMTRGRIAIPDGAARKALGHFRRAEALASDPDFPEALRTRALTHAEVMSGVTLRQSLGESAESLAPLQRALARTRELGHRWHEGTVLNQLARACLDLDRLEEHDALTRQALAIHEACGDRHNVTLARLGLAASALGRGDLDEAEDLARTALAGTVPRARPRCLEVCGTVHGRRGRTEEAERCFEEAEATLRQWNDPRNAASVTLTRARTRAERGALPEALEAAQRALRDYEAVGVRAWVVEVEVFCGTLAAFADRPELARAWLRTHAAAERPETDIVYYDLARTALARADGGRADLGPIVATMSAQPMRYETFLPWLRVLEG